MQNAMLLKVPHCINTLVRPNDEGLPFLLSQHVIHPRDGLYQIIQSEDRSQNKPWGSWVEDRGWVLSFCVSSGLTIETDDSQMSAIELNRASSPTQLTPQCGCLVGSLFCCDSDPGSFCSVTPPSPRASAFSAGSFLSTWHY